MKVVQTCFGSSNRFIGKYYKKKNSSGSPVTSLLSPPLGRDDLRVRFKQQSVPGVEGYLSGGDPLLVRLTSVSRRTALSLLHVPFSLVTQMWTPALYLRAVSAPEEGAEVTVGQ